MAEAIPASYSEPRISPGWRSVLGDLLPVDGYMTEPVWERQRATHL